MSKLDTLSLDQLSAVTGGELQTLSPPLRPRIPLRRPPSLAALLRGIQGLLHKSAAIVGY